MAKMTKLSIKILCAVLLITIISSILSTVSFAITPSDITPTEPGGKEIQTFGGKILGIVQTVGVVIAVVIIVVIGVKYLMGSAEEKAEYKKTMIPYIVGAALVGIGPMVANAIYTAFTG